MSSSSLILSHAVAILVFLVSRTKLDTFNLVHSSLPEKKGPHPSAPNWIYLFLPEYMCNFVCVEGNVNCTTLLLNFQRHFIQFELNEYQVDGRFKNVFLWIMGTFVG